MLRKMFTNAEPSDADSAMLIDQYLPRYDVTTSRHVVVDADSGTTYDAMLTADLMKLGPIVRSLGRLRDVPRVLSHRIRGTPRTPPPERMRFADVTDTTEWTHLDEVPGAEFVFGAVGKFWQPEIEWRQIESEAFPEFDEPGYAKLAISLSVRPYGEQRTLLSYEARTATTDDRVNRNFQRYWRLIGPFAGYLMSRALERIKADAEARAKQESMNSSTEAENRSRPNWSRRRVTVTIVSLVVAVYHFVLRPWYRRWETNGDAA
ncbi:hypothetical protein [Natronococcus jeotgali]|nr:hypothetical protein [Natronococcus jeotgali]